jgi:hypothetical protein
VGKEEYVATFELLSRRLPEGCDKFHETHQLRLPVSWPRFELVTYRGEVTSVTAPAGLVRKLQVPHSSYLTNWRYTTLDLRKLTVGLLHEAHKLSSCVMIFVLPPEKFSRISSEVSKRMWNYKYTGISICRSTSHHDKKKPPYEQKRNGLLDSWIWNR